MSRRGKPAAQFPFRSWERFCVHHPLDRGRGHHGDVGRTNESPPGTGAPRTPEIEVSEDDLRAIAKRGYEGAVTADLDQQAQAVGLFLSDVLLQI